MNALLEIQKLSVLLKGKIIISALDLTMLQGEILGLVGASGCGKTTLLNAIAGFVEVEGGYIKIEGNDVVRSNHFLPAQDRQVGMIFQDYALFPHLTVRQNIAFGLGKLAKDKRNKRIDKLLGLLKLTPFEGKYAHQLSGGQQQRVAIARTLATQPKLLLLDEPFSNIDARLRSELMLEIRQLLKQLNITAIFVTHNKDEVFTFADKMAVMAEGRVLQLDSPAIICQSPNSFQVADFLQLGSFITCEIEGLELSTFAGKLYLSSVLPDKQVADNQHYLLVKPQHLILNDSSNVNAQVNHIGVTEQGYHYRLSSINRNAQFAFTNLSFYSDKILTLKQHIAVEIVAHEPHVFNF